MSDSSSLSVESILSRAQEQLSRGASTTRSSYSGDAPPASPTPDASEAPGAFAPHEADLPQEPSAEYARHHGSLPRLWRQQLHRATDGPVLDVPLFQLSMAATDNIRSTEDESAFRGLVESMQVHGLLNPLIVTREPTRENHFLVLCGERRLRAATQLGWRSIRVTVREISGVADAYLLPLIDNAVRSNLTTYDVAVRCEILARQFRMPVAELAKQLNYSASHVYTLIRLLGSLPASILADWKLGHPLLSLARLDWLSHDPVGAEGKWQVMRRAHAKEEGRKPPTLEEQLAALDDEDDAAHDVTGWVPFKRPSKAAIVRLRDILARQKLPEDPRQFREIVVGLCDFFRGATSSIPHVLTPPLKKRRKPTVGSYAGMSRTA